MKTALGLRAESRIAAIELGYALLDTGEYAEVEKLTSRLLGERMSDLSAPISMPLLEGEKTTFTPAAPLSPEEGEALTLLLLSLGGQEKTEEMQTLLWDETFNKHLRDTVAEGSVLYAGGYNADGQREGKGVGIYPGGFAYVGEYRDDVRNGYGIWIGGYRFAGEWKNDSPNGTGTYRLYSANNVELACIKGSYSDGMEDGHMQITFVDGDNNVFQYQADDGERKIIDLYEVSDDFSIYIWAGELFPMYNSEKKYTSYFAVDITEFNTDHKYGVFPWANIGPFFTQH